MNLTRSINSGCMKCNLSRHFIAQVQLYTHIIIGFLIFSIALLHELNLLKGMVTHPSLNAGTICLPDILNPFGIGNGKMNVGKKV